MRGTAAEGVAAAETAMTKTLALERIIPAVCLPMTEDESIDEAALRTHMYCRGKPASRP